MSTSIGADRSRAQGLVGNPAKGIRTGLFLLCMLAVIGTLGIGTLHAQTDEGGLQKPAAEAKPSPVEPGHKLATEAIPAKPMTHLYARNPLLTGEKTRSEVWGLGEHFGVESNPTGDPIGGGEGYSRMVTNRDYTVKTKEEFLAALEKAKAGQVVYVDDEAEIDLTGHANVVIPGAVTLASGRGRNGSKGGLISTTGPDLPPRGTLWLSVAHPLLTAGGRKVRVTGIRLQGPSTKPTKHSRAWGILCRDHEGFEVDNCEMLGWTHAAIRISKAKNAYIHHNYIHHCQLNGLGYGVSLEPPVNPLIMANKFDWVRHCIASGGELGATYEACYNIVLENKSSPLPSHSFDMHPDKSVWDRAANKYTVPKPIPAGKWINVHHNTFLHTEGRAITMTGKPLHESPIHHNVFMSTDTSNAGVPVCQRATHGTGNMRPYLNLIGPNKTLQVNGQVWWRDEMLYETSPPVSRVTVDK